jgi:hypothetical protein
MKRIGNRLISLVPAIVLLLEQNTFAQPQVSAPTFRWAVKAGGPDNDRPNTLSVDSFGNCYVTGNNGNNCLFGTNLLAGGNFAAKFTQNGDLIWVKHFTAAPSMACGDAAGNCFITGVFFTPTDFGGTNLTNFGDGDIFTAKYDPQGSLLWIRQVGGSQYDYGRAVATDTSGNCYITGQFTSQYCQFGSTTLTNRSGGAKSDFCVAKFDSNGNALWAKRGGGPSALAYGSQVALDGDGNVFVAGSLPGTGVDIDGVTLPDLGPSQIGFLAKFNNAGTFLWAKRITNLLSYNLATDTAGESFLTGDFSYVATFDSFPITNSTFGPGAGLYVAKFDSSGNAVWVKTAGTYDAGRGTGVAVDTQGNCYLSATLFSWNPVKPTFGGVQLLPNQGAFVAKLDPTGGLVWLKPLGIVGSSPSDPATMIGVDPVGNAYVAGDFYVTIAFLDSFGLTNASSASDFFLGAIDRIPPKLGVSSLPGAVVLSWPSNYSDFSLEASPSLTTPQPWPSLGGTPSRVGTNCVVTDSVTNQTLFYRLRRP